jgi:hypothetical protein
MASRMIPIRLDFVFQTVLEGCCPLIIRLSHQGAALLWDASELHHPVLARATVKPAAIAAAILMTVGVAIVIEETGAEPAFKGHRLSFWLEQYTSHPAGREPATTAIRAMGTNALPVLLTMLAARDSPMKLQVLRLSHQQSLFHLTTARQYHLMARNGFHVLGRTALPALPALAKLSNDADEDIRKSALYSYYDTMGGANWGEIMK